MIIAQSIFNGFQKEIASKVFGFWGHIHISDIQSSQSQDPFMIQVNDSIRNAIKASCLDDAGTPMIKHVQSFVLYPTILSREEFTEGLFVKGVGTDFQWDFFERFLVDGSIIQITPGTPSRDLLLSEETAKRLQAKTGQSMILHFYLNDQVLKRKVRIAGIYNTGLGEYDKKFAFADIQLLQSLLGLQAEDVSGLEVICNNVLEAETVNRKLFKEVLPDTWYSETIRFKFPQIFEWLSLQDITKAFILFLILSVCIINMCTTLLILILERTHMIGILTVLGMSFWDQRKIFLRYAAQIIGSSLILGNLFGFGLIAFQKKYQLIKLSEADYYLSYAPVDLSIWPVLLLNLIFFAVILLSLLIPSWLVSFIRPVQTLKFR